MQKKILFTYCFILLSQFGILRSDESSHPLLDPQASNRYVQSLASLMFYSESCLDDLSTSQNLSEQESNKIHFSTTDVDALWNKIGQEIHKTNIPEELFLRISHFEKASQAYDHYRQFHSLGQQYQAGKSLKSTIRSLQVLWQNSLEENKLEKFGDFTLVNTTQIRGDVNFENNPHLTDSMKEMMKPYLLPLSHPMHSVLDAIFSNKRVTKDKETFTKSGFKIIATGPRSFIQVAEHPQLPSYLVKAYLDTELKKKRGKESWEWLVLRCEGAQKVRTIIEEQKIKYFAVADKWIYCLPPHPSPPKDKKHKRHHALLLTKNMQLAPEKRNYQAWLHEITKEHLNELYIIISRAKGSSYRPDNIAYVKKGKFAFIDTEYPSRGPDFKSIRPHLNTEMRAYWDKLVRQGGPKRAS